MASHKAEQITRKAREQGLRCLVVEPNRQLRLLLEDVLRKLGFQVFGTDDARQAVVMQFTESFDLVFLRWDGKPLSGDKVMEAMSILCDKMPKAVVVTGSETASFRSTAPTSAFLFEPFSTEDVVDAVWETIGDSHA